MSEVAESIAYLSHEPLQPIENHSDKLMYFFILLTSEIIKINA